MKMIMIATLLVMLSYQGFSVEETRYGWFLECTESNPDPGRDPFTMNIEDGDDGTMYVDVALPSENLRRVSIGQVWNPFDSEQGKLTPGQQLEFKPFSYPGEPTLPEESLFLELEVTEVHRHYSILDGQFSVGKRKSGLYKFGPFSGEIGCRGSLKVVYEPEDPFAY